MLSGFLTQLPLYLAWLVGILLALLTWRKHPRISALALIGFAILFLASLAGAYVDSLLPLALHQRGLTADSIGRALFQVNLVRSAFSAGGWALIIASIFSRP